MRLFLLLIILSFNCFAQEKVDKVKFADYSLENLNTRYKAVDSLCKNKGYHADLETLCDSEVKSFVVNEFKSSLHKRLSQIRDDSYALALADKRERECVMKLQKDIDSHSEWGLTYNGSETCDQLKIAIKNR